MRYFLLVILFIIFLKADTDSINTSNFDYGKIMPIEFSYINTKDDGGLYQINIGFGFFLEYDSLEMQISGAINPYIKSDTLFSGNAMSVNYGGTLLYKLNSNWQVGMGYSKYITVTNEGKYSKGTTYGDMSSYNLKLLYDPIADIIEQNNPLLMVISLGYLNAPDIIYEKKESVYNGREYEMQHIKKRYDLSGLMITLGLLKKF